MAQPITITAVTLTYDPIMSRHQIDITYNNTAVNETPCTLYMSPTGVVGSFVPLPNAEVFNAQADDTGLKATLYGTLQAGYPIWVQTMAENTQETLSNSFSVGIVPAA